ncbi:RHS repeat-associated core domain-containing protein [Mycoplasmatota bacterium]|nr:RHS repeat-associated core domain-containing protein [Mycoplasmatota bacterium]
MMLNTSVLKSGDKVIYETNGEYEIIYTYDVDGTSISFYYDNDITVKKDGNEYFYIKDLQGNISIIVDENGDIVVEYSYDAWGNIISTKEYNADGTEKTELDIAKINPYRYRGYRYDEETGYYYLNSRYYNPELGRFVNADGFLGEQGDILGHNMYAYAKNNPVMVVDPDGEFPWLVLAAILLFTPVGGTVAHVATSVGSYVWMAITSIWDDEVRVDVNAIGWNPFNKSEDKVLNSSNVSFYKGAPVFSTNGGRSGSFGAIFLSRGSDADTLRHERGHNSQLMMMGIGTYGFTVGIPSPLKLGSWDKNGNYYGAPWETMADILGGVKNRTHSRREMANAWHYYAISTVFFPATALYWF